MENQIDSGHFLLEEIGGEINDEICTNYINGNRCANIATAKWHARKKQYDHVNILYVCNGCRYDIETMYGILTGSVLRKFYKDLLSDDQQKIFK